MGYPFTEIHVYKYTQAQKCIQARTEHNGCLRLTIRSVFGFLKYKDAAVIFKPLVQKQMQRCNTQSVGNAKYHLMSPFISFSPMQIFYIFPFHRHLKSYIVGADTSKIFIAIILYDIVPFCHLSQTPLG